MTANPKPDAVTADTSVKDYLDALEGNLQFVRRSLLSAADEITRLRTELAEARGSAQSAHAVCFAAGIEAAAKYHDNFLMTKTSVAVEKVVASTEAIRALTPPDITAAAARVLIPVFEEKHRDYMLSKGRNPDDYSSHFSMAVIDLRALAEVKP